MDLAREVFHRRGGVQIDEVSPVLAVAAVEPAAPLVGVVALLLFGVRREPLLLPRPLVLRPRLRGARLLRRVCSFLRGGVFFCPGVGPEAALRGGAARAPGAAPGVWLGGFFVLSLFFFSPP